MCFTCNYASVTFFADGPFTSSTMSKETVWPTFRSSNITPCKSFEWKKRSFDSPSREMKPNPRSVRVLIVPVIFLLFYVLFSTILLQNPTSFLSTCIIPYLYPISQAQTPILVLFWFSDIAYGRISMHLLDIVRIEVICQKYRKLY